MKKLLPICFALLMSSPVNAQLDKQFQEQERDKSKKYDECSKLFDKSQYASGKYTRYYVVNNNVTGTTKYPIGELCESSFRGTLQNQSSSSLIKVEGNDLVEYYKLGSELRRRVLGTKR